jgi:3-aminobutyryl-CoA ammonia-lyase
VDFLAPIHAGDFLEIEAEIAQIGKSSRQMRFEARRVIGSLGGSSARLLEPSEVVARATGTCVVPVDRQRGPKKS